MTMSPYEGLPANRYWRSGVAQNHPLDMAELYTRKFPIEATARIATAGSCFAQHISRHMRQRGYGVIDAEPAPTELDAATAMLYGYGLYSARYGNIYTTRQLLQLAQEAFGQFTPHNAVWEKDGRYFDALRPSVEPKGLRSAAHVAMQRKQHLSAVRHIIETANVFVFTLGLTETWLDRESGTAYPTAPGTIAGTFDPNQVNFHNLSYHEVLEDFLAFRSLMQGVNPSVRFILTVSPVPLTATATNSHVLSATTYSKSVLRAVAGYLSAHHDDIDYFPSYEIIAAPPMRGFFFDPNMRSVNNAGVARVMQVFFGQHGSAVTEKGAEPAAGAKPATEEDGQVVCEDALLDAFSR